MKFQLCVAWSVEHTVYAIQDDAVAILAGQDRTANNFLAILVAPSTVSVKTALVFALKDGMDVIVLYVS